MTSNLLLKALQIVQKRIQTQGFATTLLWLRVRLSTALTGVPSLRYCRVTPNLFVGGQHRARGKRKLENHGVYASVNMREESDDRLRGVALQEHCHLPTTDDHAPTLDQLNEGVGFTRAVLENGGKVYIHCGGGIGRAPSMAAAYLISTGDSVEEALDRIRAVRPFINLTELQIQQLELFAERMAAQAAAG